MNPPPPAIGHASIVDKEWNECWKEFQLWKDQYATNELSSAIFGKAAVPLIKLEQESHPVMAVSPTATQPGHRTERANLPSSSQTQQMTVWKFPLQGDESGPITNHHHDLPVYSCDLINDTGRPVAPYEACVPITHNVEVDNTAFDLDILEFIPYGNEPEFVARNPGLFVEQRTRGQQEKTVRLAWEMSNRNPDIDVVVCEAARRLQNRDKLSIKDIDEANALPISFVIDNGSLWDPLNTRTALPWPVEPFIVQNPTFRQLLHSENSVSTQERLRRLSNVMCMTLSCIQPACPGHGIASQPHPKTSRPSINQLIDACGEPCGVECFQSVDLPESGTDSWSEDELRDLEDVWDNWDATSRLSMCALARMVFKPCWEAFEKVHRLEQSADPGPLEAHSDSSSEASQSYRRRTIQELNFGSHTSSKYIYARPCNHDGPCQAGVGCVCYQRAHRCRRTCSCDSTCPRRWKGCSCVGRHRQCRSSRCECVNFERECDPELCRTCGSFNGRPCRNVEIRLGRKKKSMVIMKDYPWGPGWGLQIMESANSGDFVDEYVGEVVGYREFELRNLEAEHSKRNYLFSLDVDRTIDSARAANETRFINHALGKKENLEAKVLFIDDEPRIGFYAKRKIKAGEELCFNYGEKFWSQGHEMTIVQANIPVR